MQHISEPIAVIGAACRFPGRASTLESYWTLLEQGIDAVSSLPEDRCSLERFFSASRTLDGHAYVNAAGIIEDIKYFDADFFGISRKEAEDMDPQQRIVLETTWEALESAFITPSSLKGSRTGVFMGASNMDMSMRGPDDPPSISPYAMTGSTLGIIANRISYLLDLHGPSMTIDTACSSSLVAVHQACEALRNGQIALAIAGGVNILLAPYPFIGFSQARMLSPDGRCKVFDASGNGYVRSEGGGTIILKPLSKAIADNDAILAVIAGTGVNSDGRTTGIALPNGTAQAELLRDVYEQFQLDKRKLAYVEAHGTGTAAGDPIEAGAIGTVLGRELRGQRPLFIGSAKTNIGHLEPAAGIAGLLKGVAILCKGKIPPNLHFTSPNPAIDFRKLNLVVPTETVDLPDLGGDELISVNSFGFGGANAHVVLRKAPFPAKRPLKREAVNEEACPPLLLSATSPRSLAVLAGQYAAALENAGPEQCYDTAATLAAHREHLKYRQVITAAPAKLCAQLKKLEKTLSQEDTRLKAVTGVTDAGVFVFTGNGSQWPGMGTGLMQSNKTFKAALEEVDALLKPLQGWSLLDILARPEEHSDAFTYTEISQPLLFAIQVALTKALKVRGIRPSATMGHSVGEVAAAWACGALSLEDAVTVIHYRSSLQRFLRDKGSMAVASASEERIQELLERFNGAVELAAHNTESSFTLAGETKSLRAFVQLCKQQRIAAKMLNVPYPFHTALMDEIHDSLKTSLAAIRPRKPRIPFFLTALPDAGLFALPDGDYWWHNVRNPVYFHQAASAAMRQGFSLFMEIGPAPLLSSYLRDISRKDNVRIAFTPSLTKKGDEPADFEAAWKNAWQCGWKLHVDDLFPLPFQKRPLPVYPWNREYLWSPDTPECREFLSTAPRHPLLGWRLPGKAPLFEQVLHLPDAPWLADHKAGTRTPYPAAAFIESVLAAGRELYPEERQEVEWLSLYRPLQLSEDRAKVVRVSVDREDGGVIVEARGHMQDEPFSLYARGRIVPQAASSPEQPLAFASPEAFGIAVSKNFLYATAQRFMLNYGPAFQMVEQAWFRSDSAAPEVLARLAEPFAQSAKGMLIPPTLLDGAFQSLFILLGGHNQIQENSVYLPVAFERIVLYSQGVPRYAHTRLKRVSSRSVTASFRLTDADGKVLLYLRNCRFRRAAWLEHEKSRSCPYSMELVPSPHPSRTVPLKGISLSELGATAERALQKALQPRENTSQRAVHPYMLLQLTALAAAHETVLSLADHASPLGLSPRELTEGGVVSPDQEYWLCRMLERLEENGRATRENGRWRVQGIQDGLSAQKLWRTLLSSSPRSAPEALLLAHVFSRHKELLEAREASFLGKLTEAYFSNAASLTLFYDVMRQCLQETLRKGETEGHITVLQLAKDTKGLLSHLLPLIRVSSARSACRYIVAEKGKEQAKATALAFDAEPCLEVTSLDLDAPGQEHMGAYQFIVLDCVLYEYQNCSQAIQNCLNMLVPGGVLCLREHVASPFTDYVFGAEPWWWKDSREREQPVSPLQPRTFWEEELFAAGFSEVLPLGTEYDRSCPGALFLARKSLEEDGLSAVAPDAAFPVVPVQELPLIPLADAALLPENEPEPDTVPVSHWLLLAETPASQGGRLAESLCHELKARGASVTVHHHGETLPDEASMSIALSNWMEAVQPKRKKNEDSAIGVLHVAYLHGYNTTADLSLRELSRIQEAGTVGLAALAKALDRLPQTDVWVVSGGALSGAGRHGSPVPSQGALAGFTRVLMNEMRRLPLRLLDVHGAVPALSPIAEEFLRATEEKEVVLIDGKRYVPRLTPIALLDPSQTTTAEDVAGKDRGNGAVLTFDSPGRLQQLYWRKTSGSPSLKDNEVCVQVKYAGLNFRDVMWSMGLLQDEALENGFSGPTMGIECSGVIAAVGKAVKDWEAGDEVVCFAPACLASHVVTIPSALVRKPASLSFAEAATIPVCFFTAWYSIKHLANLRAGERILIHGAAGGVGLAAVQIAAHLGLEVYATAGAPEKHHFLRRLGVKRLFSSRSLSFADEVRAATGGQGVDCVLNSLAGEAISAGLSVLRPFGRFIELGKRDFYADTPMRLRPFSNNLSYFGVDIDQLLIHQPDLARSLFTELMDLFTQRRLAPLPHTTYSASRITQAFQAMQQSSHVGKLVISLEGASKIAREKSGRMQKLQLESDASYLVTGGTDGFGLATARRLVRRGAKHLLLVSRNGAKSEEALREIELLRSEGVQVIPAMADVTEPKELKACLSKHCAQLPPLRGIVHAAAVLDDGTITSLTPERIQRSLAAKTLGAWNLHMATRDMPLDFFVLYSSATTAFGNPGQAGYVAANCMLESLASWRRQQGLPASVIGWGPISDTGMLTRNPKAQTMLLQILGVYPTDSKDALYWLEHCIARDIEASHFFGLDWQSRSDLPVLAVPKFSRLRPKSASARGTQTSPLESIRSATPEEAVALIGKLLIEECAAVLRLPEDRFSIDTPLASQGMDSLMVVELSMAIEQKFELTGYTLPFSEKTTAASLASSIYKSLVGTESEDFEKQAIDVLGEKHGVTVDDTLRDSVLQALNQKGDV